MPGVIRRTVAQSMACFMLGIHTGEGSKHHDGKGSADGKMLGIGVAAYALQLQRP